MSNATDVLNSLIYQANQRTINPTSVGSNLALWSGVALGTIITFNILRPKNKIVYQPKVKYHVGDKKPPPISDGIFSWIPPILYSKEAYLLDKVGLDAVVFLRFLRLLRYLFSLISLLACFILIPVDITYNLAHVPSAKRDVLSILTIRDVAGVRLYAHIAAEYVIKLSSDSRYAAGLVIYFVYTNWKDIIRLRHTYFRSAEYNDSFYARTLLVQRVPKSMRSDEGLQSLFKDLNVPYPATSVHISRDVGRLPDLIKYHDDAVRDLERILVRYLKGGKLGRRRPTITVGGFLGCCGVKKDAIDFYTNRIRNAERSIEEARAQIAASKGKAEKYGFASMAAVPYAHIVAHRLRNVYPKGTIIQSAPNPKDIIWENLNASDMTISRKKTLGWVYLSVFAFFNTIPVFAISVLANLNAIAHFVPFLARIANEHTSFFAFVSGVLPPTVSAIFGYFLPYVMRWLSQYQGAITHSRLDRAVVARYFAFMIISQKASDNLSDAAEGIVSKIGKYSFNEIIGNLNQLPGTINATYINQSSYWLTYFPLRGFLAVFDLAQLLNLVWTAVRTRIFGRTPRDIREFTKPPEFEYAIYYVNMLFMAAVGFVFAPLAPLVSVMACAVFWISSVVYKYQLMFVFVTRVESGGRLWNSVINRLLISVIFMQLFMTLTIGLQLGWLTFQWTVTLPPILMLVALKIYINRVFVRQFQYYIPDEMEIASCKVHSERSDRSGNRLANRFGHPALHAELYTPLLHAKMAKLLPEVYQGRLATQEAKLTEYGGQKLATQITPEGVRIATIEQRDLEYDPMLYQRDRGELDWDQRSIASSGMMNLQPGPYSDGRASPAPNKLLGYENYLTNGPGQVEKLPLLHPTDSLPSLGRMDSATSLPGYAQQVPVTDTNPMAGMHYPSVSTMPPMDVDQHRQAPIYRPFTPQVQGASYMNQPYASQGQDMHQPPIREAYSMPAQPGYPTRPYSPQVGSYPPQPQTRPYPPTSDDMGGGRSTTPGSFYRNNNMNMPQPQTRPYPPASDDMGGRSATPGSFYRSN
ncbi:hypothetical protein Clacol_002690 [Clathrus columnatus]|uniref:DUF221-domain-containing protein n=1 Tax=Clathrus columnatus TaxID=1419009 RepID=A0AAV5A4T4_9AGAM|nr:hypothetical protein Clacol_002690 [Clathrus columnatus]